MEMFIPQLDGNADQNIQENENPENHIFSVNCEVKEIINLLNFFRSFNFMWISNIIVLMIRLIAKRHLFLKEF